MKDSFGQNEYPSFDAGHFGVVNDPAVVSFTLDGKSTDAFDFDSSFPVVEQAQVFEQVQADIWDLDQGHLG